MVSIRPIHATSVSATLLSGRSAFMLWSGIPALCQRYQQLGRTVGLDGLIHVEHVESLRQSKAWVTLIVLTVLLQVK